MTISETTKHAIIHTLHCLLGCSIGEIGGMILGTALHWHNLAMIVVSIILSFFFGYLLTTYSLLRKGNNLKFAVRTAVATDTVSIISMELIDNVFIVLVPGALDTTLKDALFWYSLLASLAVAFVLTVPVNRWMLVRNTSQVHNH